jgi:hypothetical protein
MLMTGVMLRVSVLSEGGGGWQVEYGGRYEAIVLFLFLAVSFLSFCVEGVSRFCLSLSAAL